MPRLPLIAVVLLSLSACQTTESDFVGGRERICRVHHVPLITRRMFTTRPGLLVHYRYDRCIQCEERSPNHIITYYSLVRTQLHRIPTTFPYCTLCEEEFRRCVKDAPCYEADLTNRCRQPLAALMHHFKIMKTHLLQSTLALASGA
jgi:hypothetical protein